MVCKKALLVILVAFVVFLVPGFILTRVTDSAGAEKIMAFSIVFSIFFHPLQLMAVDWACGFTGLKLLEK